MYYNDKYVPLTRKEEIETILAYQNGDVSAGDKLINSLTPWVMKLVSKVYNKFNINSDFCEQFDDVVQVAMMGLLKAIKKFDVERGCRLSTFGSKIIYNECISYLFKTRLIKIPLYHMKSENCLSKFVTNVYSIDKAMEGVHGGSVVPSAIMEKVDEYGVYECQLTEMEKRELLTFVLVEIGRLPAKWSFVMEQKFLRGRTEPDIANQIGVSRQRINQIYKEAVKRIRIRVEEIYNGSQEQTSKGEKIGVS